MSILVTGGTGQVGRETVARLLALGAPVRALVRPEGRRPPAPAEPVVGDLRDAASLAAAMRGVERLFLLTPLSETETEEGLAAVAAARAAGVKRIVFLTVHRLEEAAHIPHFASKIPVVAAIKASGAAWTLIEPNNFYQNDLGLLETIAAYGVYPQPLGGIGLHRVDTRDIGEAVATALLTDGHAGKAYPLVGPEAVTGDSTAAAYARALGRPVAYGGDDLEAWGQAVGAFVPPWMVTDLKVMYAHFQTKGLRATEAELTACRSILGHAPRGFEAFLADTALPAMKPG